jgi:hypothetical protein
MICSTLLMLLELYILIFYCQTTTTEEILMEITYILTQVQTPGLPRTLYFHQSPSVTELQE